MFKEPFDDKPHPGDNNLESDRVGLFQNDKFDKDENAQSKISDLKVKVQQPQIEYPQIVVTGPDTIKNKIHDTNDKDYNLIDVDQDEVRNFNEEKESQLINNPVEPVKKSKPTAIVIPFKLDSNAHNKLKSNISVSASPIEYTDKNKEIELASKAQLSSNLEKKHKIFNLESKNGEKIGVEQVARIAANEPTEMNKDSKPHSGIERKEEKKSTFKFKLPSSQGNN